MQAYKYKVKPPNKQVVTKLENHLAACCELYNAALQERRDAYKLNRISLNYFDQANQLSDIKDIRDDLTEIHSQVLQDILKRVDKTFKSFFARIKRKEKAGFPRFKSNKRFDSFCFPQSGFKLVGDKLTLSKIGTLRLRLSRPIEGKIKTCTVKREVSGWFVVFTVENEIKPLPKTGEEIGLDAGIACFLKLSDGSDVDNPRFGEKLQKSLRVAQRSVSRKKKGGKNRKKAVLKLRKIHQKIRNCRADFQHKAAHWLVNSYDLICIEKLQVSNMLKNHCLARVISDVSWSSFYQILKAKAECAERLIVEVPPHHTSQTCSRCGHCEKANRRTQADFVCLKCHFSINADHNAAINILALGKKLLHETYRNVESVCKESLTITASV